jgi:galactokinase
MVIESFAPGRVELLGNHTDYNGGVVLSCALELGVTASGESAGGERILLRSEGEEPHETTDLQRTGTWADYPLGVVHVFREAGLAVGGFEASYTSTLPIGAGLSSSAAIEVATAMLLCRLFSIHLEPMDLARLCRRAENAFVGVNCGLLDQATSVFGRRGEAVFLDCRDETVTTVPFPRGTGLLVINSGVKHALTGGEYNERREACFEAARLMGVAALRDADASSLERTPMPDRVRRRAAHVIGENARVLEGIEALRANNAPAFGRLMSASHQSSIANFENSTPELDLLVELAMAQPGIAGARLTGGGFGGAIVAIGREGALAAAGSAIAGCYHAQTGHVATPMVCHPGDGALALSAAQ